MSQNKIKKFKLNSGNDHYLQDIKKRDKKELQKRRMKGKWER